jgi:Brp/Blh family beta-carotene 15,15'-monooxygenase
LWFFHWEAQSEIISTFFPWNLASASSLHLFVKCSVLATGLITVSLLALLFKRGQLSGIMLAQELSVLLSLLLLFYFTSPYIAFAIYFGLWHAMRVIFTEYHFLKVKAPASFTSGAFIRSFVPFSLLSFAGLGFLFLLSQWLQASISPFMLFFIFISALTMPHAFFMEKMYRFLGNKLVV